MNLLHKLKTYSMFYKSIAFFTAALFFGLYNYGFFHITMEMMVIVLSAGIFIFAVNTRKYCSNDFFYFFGIVSFFFIVIGFFHIISMNKTLFPGVDENESVQLWVSASFIQAISFLISPYFLSRRLNVKLIVLTYIMISLFLGYMIFETKTFPVCLDAAGVTTVFKKTMEIIIAVIMLLSFILIHKYRVRFVLPVYVWFSSAIVLLVAAQILFAIYINLFGFIEIAGYALKIAGYYAIYRAVIVNGLNQSVENLLNKLMALVKEKNNLIDRLNEEKAAVKVLRGLLPICCSCKKIRDDQGYWNMLETYISKHSHAEFRHSICPECANKLYPGLMKDNLFNDEKKPSQEHI